MNRTREPLLPSLCHWITFLAHALPLRSVPTFSELVGGALLSQRGGVTAAYLAITAQRHWTSYYKGLPQGRGSWVRLGSIWRSCCAVVSNDGAGTWRWMTPLTAAPRRRHRAMGGIIITAGR